MSAVLAVNIGYSPRHAGAPPGTGSPSPRRRSRTIVLMLCAFALLCAGVTIAALRAASHATCADRRDCATGPPAGPRVVVYSAARLGLAGPAGLAQAGGKLW